MWAEVPVKLFHDCQSQMKTDDFLHTDKMGSFDAMSALDVDLPKIDCHRMANNKFSVKDLIDSGYYLPDESITYDEIRKIMGYYLDTIVARFDGHTVYQTTLLSVYAHQGYTIKNELLKAVILSFVALSNELENFASAVFADSVSSWTVSRDFNLIVHPYDIDEISKLLEKFQNNKEIADIVDFAKYILNFAIYLKEFPQKPLPELPKLPELSESIGFAKELHLRDLPTRAPPTAMQILPHEKSNQKFIEIINLIKEIVAIPVPKTIIEAIKQASDWSLKHFDAPIFPRMVRLRLAFDKNDDSFYGKTFIDFIKPELAAFHTPDALYAKESFKAIFHIMYQGLSQCIRNFWLPNAVCTTVLEKQIFNFWGRCQDTFLRTEGTESHPRPKTTSMSHTNLLKTTISTWGQLITAHICIEYVRQLLVSGVLIPDDYIFISLLLSQAYQVAAESLEKKRTVDAIYAVMQHRGPKHNSPISNNDIERKIQPEDEEQLTFTALSQLWNATFYGLRCAILNGGYKLKEAPYHNSVKLYEHRIKCVNKLDKIQLMDKESYEFLMKGSANPLDDATKKYIAARPFIKKAVDANQDKSREAYYKSMMLGSVLTPMNLGKRKTEEIKFEISEDLLPSINLVA